MGERVAVERSSIVVWIRLSPMRGPLEPRFFVDILPPRVLKYRSRVAPGKALPHHP
jgi:hypothetical protein